MNQKSPYMDKWMSANLSVNTSYVESIKMDVAIMTSPTGEGLFESHKQVGLTVKLH